MVKDQIIGIYDYISSGNIDSSKYYFRYLLSSLGEVDTESIRDVYDEMYLKMPVTSDSLIGPFDDVDGITRFSYLLCEKISAKKMSLISVKNYNEFMEEVPITETFFTNLFAKGEIIENQRNSKMGILSSIFNN